MDAKVKEFFEKVKFTASTVGGNASSTVKKAGQKTGEVLEITKLNMKIFDLNTEISMNMKKLGQMVYDTHTGVDINEKETEDVLSLIDSKKEEIRQCKEKINEFRKIKLCPNCGTQCSEKSQFCSECGTEL